MKFLPVIILFISSVTLANEDPCERTDYPVTTVKEFKTLADNSFPSVYRHDDNSKVTVTVLKLKSIIEKEMRSHRPYLKKGKRASFILFAEIINYREYKRERTMA